MGDRAYLEVHFRAADAEAVAGVIPWASTFEPDDRLPGLLSFHEVEANYGGDDYLQMMAAEGVVFEGHHDAGESYCAKVFACSGDAAIRWAPRVHGIYDPAVSVLEDGSLDQDELRAALVYWDARRQVVQLCAQTRQPAQQTEVET